MKNIISISGAIAAGKTEVSTILSERLSMELYKASDMVRQTARDLNMSMVEYNEYIKLHEELDTAVEYKTREIVNSKDNIIIDARLGFYIVPDSFKVYIFASKEVAALRLYEASKIRGKEENYINIDDALTGIVKREEYEEKRWLKLYNINIHDKSQYDLVIDSTDKSSDEVVKLIIDEYNIWKKSQGLV